MRTNTYRSAVKKKPIHVLLIEDDPIQRDIVHKILDRESCSGMFTLNTAETLSDGLKALSKHFYDIILLDIMLPDSRGIHTIKKVCGQCPDMPVVIFTSIKDRDIELKAIEYGVIDYVSKSEPLHLVLPRVIPYAIARKNIEKELILSKSNFESIVEKSVDGIIVVDCIGIICFINESAAKLFGKKREELINELFGLPLAFQESVEIDIIRKDSEQGIAEMRVVSTQWKGEPASLALIRDVTEYKRTAEQLRNAMKIQSDFTSMVSHELRTPLTAIKEGVALVMDETTGSINGEQRELLSISKRNVDRLSRLINDVLDFQKLDSGKMHFNMQQHQINKLAEDVYSAMLTVVKDKPVDLLLNLSENIPAIKFDYDKISQVLTNLVNNAIKFTSEGMIEISTDYENGFVSMSVSDTGVGIKQSDLSRVFDRFEQLATGNRRKTGGSGLGLAISKEIVIRHGGEIKVESEEGNGSRFSVILPENTTESNFRRYLDDQLHMAEKSNSRLSLLSIFLNNHESLKRVESNEKNTSILTGIEKIFINYVSNPNYNYVVYDLSEEILAILINWDKSDVLRVQDKIYNLLNDYTIEFGFSDKINFGVGVASYPQDAQTAEKLIQKARQQLVLSTNYI